MVIVCDACETLLSKGKSNCCKANVWWKGKGTKVRDLICMECKKKCKIIKVKEDIRIGDDV